MSPFATISVEAFASLSRERREAYDRSPLCEQPDVAAVEEFNFRAYAAAKDE